MKKIIVITLSFIILGFALTCCGPSEEEIAMMLSNTQTAIASEWTLTPSDTPTNVPTATKEPTNTPLPTNTPTPDCIPGNSFDDAEGDVSLPHIDLLRAETSLEATKLTVVLYLKEIPEEITVNRNEIEKGYQEYLWAVHVDTDNDPFTGDRQYGAEYSMQIHAFKWGVERTGAFDNLLSASIWKNEIDSARSSGAAQMIVDYDADTITLIGYIPGITPESRLYFGTFDENPGGYSEMDEICTGY